MRRAIITGSSRGIGRALSEAFLAGGYEVLGISRSNENPFRNPSFSHLSIDLAGEFYNDQRAVEPIKRFCDCDELILVNNAGRIGETSYFEDAAMSDFEETIQLNFLAAVRMTNLLLKWKNENQSIIILNISSGAAKSIIDGWSAYCSSKAAMDSWISVLDNELRQRGEQKVKVYAISPGVVDTQMQKEIRESHEGQFSRREYFRDLKRSKTLKSPTFIADLIYKIAIDSIQPESYYVSLRDYY